jgi:hypothetical protein
MGRSVYCISHGYAACALSVQKNNFTRAGGKKQNDSFQTRYWQAFAGISLKGSAGKGSGVSQTGISQLFSLVNALKTLPNAASGGLIKNKKEINYFAGMKKPINLLPLLKHNKN